MTCSAVTRVLKPRRAILSGFSVRNSTESGFLSMWSGGARPFSEVFLTQDYSWLSSVLPEFAPFTPWSSNFSERAVSRQLVEVFSTASNRPDEGFCDLSALFCLAYREIRPKKEAICSVRRPPALSGRGAVCGVLTSEMYQFESAVSFTESPG